MLAAIILWEAFFSLFSSKSTCVSPRENCLRSERGKEGGMQGLFSHMEDIISVMSVCHNEMLTVPEKKTAKTR